MNPNKMTPHEIYSFLSSKNYNLSSEKIFKEPFPNSDTIWAILAFLASNNYSNQTYQQIQPMLVYLLDADIYNPALKKIKQYTAVSKLLGKVSPNTNGAFQYPIKDILKPQKDFVIQRISALISFNKYSDKVQKKFESHIFQNKMLKNTLKEYKQKLDEKLNEIEEVKMIKQQEKQVSDEKLKLIQSLNKDIAYKKKEKLDLLNSQQELNNQFNKKRKAIDESQYNKDDRQIQIKRLERQVILNAPKLKKDRINIIEEFQQMREQKQKEQIFFQRHIEINKQKLRQTQGIKSICLGDRIDGIYHQLQELKRNREQTESALSKNDSLKCQRLQEKMSLLKKIQNRENQLKKTLDLNSQVQQQGKKLKQNGNKLQQQLKKYGHIVSMLEEKVTVQKSHDEELRERFYRKKKQFEEEIRERSLIYEALTKEVNFILSSSFEDFTS